MQYRIRIRRFLICGLLLAVVAVPLVAIAGDFWTQTGSLGTARRGHTATRLADGRVLVAGGYGDMAYLSSAE